MTTLTAVAVNAATSVETRWPFGLEHIRGRPFLAIGVLTVLAAVLGLVMVWSQAERPASAEAPLPDRPYATDPAPRRYPWLPDLCPVCGALLNAEPEWSENQGRYAMAPPFRVHATLDRHERGPAWRLETIGSRVPPVRSVEPPFWEDNVEHIYQLCGNGHVFHVASPDRTASRDAEIEEPIERWSMIASFGAVASGKSYVVFRMLHQALGESRRWPGASPRTVRRRPVAPLERLKYQIVDRYDSLLREGQPLPPTCIVDAQTSLLQTVVPDLVEAVQAIVRTAVVDGERLADQWGRNSPQPFVLRTGTRRHQQWTGIVDLPGEILSNFEESQVKARLRSYDAILWAVDPMLSQPTQALIEATCGRATVMEASIRPGSVVAGKFRRVTAVRAVGQQIISRQIAALRNTVYGDREAALMVVITKSDLIRALLENDHLLTVLGEPGLVRAGASKYLDAVRQRYRAGEVDLDYAGQQLMSNGAAAGNAQLAAQLLHHYSAPATFWNLAETGHAERLPGTGILVPSIAQHVDAFPNWSDQQTSVEYPPRLPMRDLVMSAVGYGIAFGLDQPADLHLILRDSEHQLPRAFLTSALGAVPNLSVHDTTYGAIEYIIRPDDKHASFAEGGERSAGITQLLLAAVASGRSRPTVR